MHPGFSLVLLLLLLIHHLLVLLLVLHLLVLVVVVVVVVVVFRVGGTGRKAFSIQQIRVRRPKSMVNYATEEPHVLITFLV